MTVFVVAAVLLIGVSHAVLLPSEHFALMRLFDSLGTQFLHLNSKLTVRPVCAECSNCIRFPANEECTPDADYLTCEQQSVTTMCVVHINQSTQIGVELDIFGFFFLFLFMQPTVGIVARWLIADRNWNVDSTQTLVRCLRADCDCGCRCQASSHQSVSRFSLQ